VDQALTKAVPRVYITRREPPEPLLEITLSERCKMKKALLITDRKGPQNYLAKVLRAAKTLPKGTIAHANITHEAWCSMFEGGSCDCDPDVSLVWRDSDD